MKAALCGYSADLGMAKGADFEQLASQSTAAVAKAAGGIALVACVTNDLNRLLQQAQAGVVAAKEATDAKQTVEQQKEELESGLFEMLDTHMVGLAGGFDALVPKCKATEGKPMVERVASALADLLTAAKEALAANSSAEEELEALRAKVETVIFPDSLVVSVFFEPSMSTAALSK